MGVVGSVRTCLGERAARAASGGATRVGAGLRYTRLRDADILRALVFLVRMATGRTSGRPKSRAFVDFLFAQFPERPTGLAAPEETASRLIVP